MFKISHLAAILVSWSVELCYRQLSPAGYILNTCELFTLLLSIGDSAFNPRVSYKPQSVTSLWKIVPKMHSNKTKM